MRDHGDEFNLPQDFAWGAPLQAGSDSYMWAGTRVSNAYCADADSLTRAEIEGRRQVRAIMDIVRRYKPDHALTLDALPARIGIRESRHVRCQYQLTGDDVLYGKRFNDAITNCSYRVDVHHVDKPGITLQYLNGTQDYCRPSYPGEKSRWRPETATNPVFYQVPLRSLVPKGPYKNVIVAGRMFDADPIAHAAVRVMVNMSQTGEAAGVTAFLALQGATGIDAVPPRSSGKHWRRVGRSSSD